MQTQLERPLAAARADTDAGLRAHLLNVYGLVALGIAISGAVALGVGRSGALDLFYHVNSSGKGVSYTGLGILAIVVTFGSLIAAAVGRWADVAFPAVVMHAIYWIFTSSIGVTISVLLANPSADIVTPMLATAIAFSGLCIFGHATRLDLTGLGSCCIMGLWGLVGVGLIGMFTGFRLPVMAESAAGILVFTGLTAYDAQKIKLDFIESRDGSAGAAVWDAMGLYLDAINIFIRLFMLLNSSSDD
jgi:FtsH-binding integral membrane protein